MPGSRVRVRGGCGVGNNDPRRRRRWAAPGLMVTAVTAHPPTRGSGYLIIERSHCLKGTQAHEAGVFYYFRSDYWPPVQISGDTAHVKDSCFHLVQ